MNANGFQLRFYQSQAIMDTAKAIAGGAKRVLLVAPTGSGKSVLIGGICGRAMEKNTQTRILVLCASSHILEQNEEKIKLFAPKVHTGIYCAGLKRKDIYASVILASRDSLGRQPEVCGKFDGILIDEAHQVAVDLEDSDTLYARILASQNPKWVVGLTGTPWRLSGGRIWGEDKWFEKITSNISMETLRREGFLVPYIFPRIQNKVDTSQVQKSSTGDFAIRKLEEVSSIDSVVKECIEEWRRYVGDRKVTLFFCVTRAHARKTALMIQEMTGIEAAYIDGETTGNERKGLLDDIRAGKYRAVCSVGVLTTGFDAPVVDCIVLIRATLSAALFVQMCGRGLRPYQDKTNLLILDMAGNFERFGSLERPLIKSAPVQSKDEDEEEATCDNSEPEEMFSCPSCGYSCKRRARFCPYCLEMFKLQREETFGEAKWYSILNVTVIDYLTKKGEQCKRITYTLAAPQFKKVHEYMLYKRGGWHQRMWEKRFEQIKRGRISEVKGRIEGWLIRVEDIKESEHVRSWSSLHSSSLQNTSRPFRLE